MFPEVTSEEAERNRKVQEIAHMISGPRSEGSTWTDSARQASSLALAGAIHDRFIATEKPVEDISSSQSLQGIDLEGSVSLEGLRFPVSTRASSAPRLVEHGEVDEESIRLVISMGFGPEEEDLNREDFEDGYWVVFQELDTFGYEVEHHLLNSRCQGRNFSDWREARTVAMGMWRAMEVLAKRTEW